MKREKYSNLLIVFLLVMTMASCTSGAYYQKNLSIPNGQWERNEKATFNFDINDTTSSYALFLNVRHAGNYPYKNLYLFTKTISPEGKLTLDTAQMIFANDKGRWVGKGIGDIYDYQFKFKKNLTFSDSGMYQFEIEQAMRDKVLSGVTDIGIKIEKVEK